MSPLIFDPPVLQACIWGRAGQTLGPKHPGPRLRNVEGAPATPGALSCKDLGEKPRGVAAPVFPVFAKWRKWGDHMSCFTWAAPVHT